MKLGMKSVLALLAFAAHLVGAVIVRHLDG